MNDSWHSYPKIYNLGHAALTELFNGPTIIQEKIDGSQFSFGMFNGELRCRSKGVQLVLDAPEKMFLRAIESVKARRYLLKDGWTYRCEYLQSPKHNTLAYNRVPNDNLILFDINIGEEFYLSYQEMQQEAIRLNLELVPLFAVNITPTVEFIKQLMQNISCLGGQKIEGIVVKNYTQFGSDKKALMGKHVSEEFKEVHKGEWRKTNPTTVDVVEILTQSYRTPARWNKAVQHLKERGELTQSPKDIGNLIKETQFDIVNECEQEIKEALWQQVKGKLLRACTGGLPEWYKDQLLQLQFKESKNE